MQYELRSCGVPDWGPIVEAVLHGAGVASLFCGLYSAATVVLSEFVSGTSVNIFWNDLNWTLSFVAIFIFTAFLVILASCCVLGLPIHAALSACNLVTRRCYRLAGVSSALVVVVVAVVYGLYVLPISNWSGAESAFPSAEDLPLAGWLVSCGVLAGWVAADRFWAVLRPDLRRVGNPVSKDG